MDELGVIEKPITIKIGSQEYAIDYSMASIYFLQDKYGDVSKIFPGLGEKVDPKYIDTICDLIYAGLIKCNDEDHFISPLTSRQIMSNIHFKDLALMVNAITDAFSRAFPKAKENPTKAVKTAKTKIGIGDTSTPDQLD